MNHCLYYLLIYIFSLEKVSNIGRKSDIEVTSNHNSCSPILSYNWALCLIIILYYFTLEELCIYVELSLYPGLYALQILLCRPEAAFNAVSKVSNSCAVNSLLSGPPRLPSPVKISPWNRSRN
jgi:hypothetical protein